MQAFQLTSHHLPECLSARSILTGWPNLTSDESETRSLLAHNHRTWLTVFLVQFHCRWSRHWIWRDIGYTSHIFKWSKPHLCLSHSVYMQRPQCGAKVDVLKLACLHLHILLRALVFHRLCLHDIRQIKRKSPATGRRRWLRRRLWSRGAPCCCCKCWSWIKFPIYMYTAWSDRPC